MKISFLESRETIDRGGREREGTVLKVFVDGRRYDTVYPKDGMEEIVKRKIASEINHAPVITYISDNYRDWDYEAERDEYERSITW